MNLWINDILNATRGKLLSGSNTQSVNGISTDSREINRNCLFIALKGEQFDGHDYLYQAFEKGAAAALVQKDAGCDPRSFQSEAVLVEVDSTLTALGDLANFWRRQFKTTVIAITGSNGKTSTKELAYNIISRKMKAVKSPGNWNNLIGVPLSLFRLDGSQAAAIIEMGMSEKGEIRRLAEIAEPDIGVITNVGPSHLENFSSLDDIGEAKGELFDCLGPGRTAIANISDRRVARLAERTRAGKIYFGFEQGTLQARNIIDQKADGTAYDLVIDGKIIPVTTDRPGRAFIVNDLAAAAIAHTLGIDPENIKKGLEKSPPVTGRMEKINMHGITLINDAYNANPVSMEAALDQLAKMDTAGNRIAVLADMLELGDGSSRFHEALGKKAAAANLDRLFLYGNYKTAVETGAVSAGMPPDRIHAFEDMETLCRTLNQQLRPGDTVLLKGSRGMRLERIIAHIKENREQPTEANHAI